MRKNFFRPLPKQLFLGLTASFVIMPLHFATAQTADMYGVAASDQEIRIQLTPAEEARIASRMNGTIVEIPVQDGQPVNKGDLLIRFECAERQQRLDQAQARLTRQRSLLDSTEKLVQLGSGSKVDLNVHRAEAQEAEANMALSKTEAAYCEILAPFNGRVSALAVKPFQTIQENTFLAEVIQDETLKAEMIVPSRYLSWLKKDTSFPIRIDETGQTYEATISHLGGRVDPISQSVKIYAEVRDRKPELLAGMSGVALLEQPEATPQEPSATPAKAPPKMLPTNP